MDHLLDFPSDADGIYDTPLDNKKLQSSQFEVPLRSTETHFEVYNFNSLPRDRADPPEDHCDSLIEIGPEAICKYELVSSPTTTAIEGFLQSWLFFSLIALVIGERVETRSFVRNSSFVHTNNLRRLLEQWQARVNSNQDTDVRRHRMIDRALDDASHFVSRWCDDIDRWNISPVLWLSFAIVGETLTRARTRVLKHLDHDGAHERHWGTSNFLKRVIIERGWCPSLPRMFQSTHGSLSGLYVLGSLKPPKEYSDGCLKAPSESTHSRCTAFMCDAFVVSKPQIQFPLHSVDQCPEHGVLVKKHCRDVEPDMWQVEDILLRGNFPLVRVNVESIQVDGQQRLEQEVIEVFEYDLSTGAVVPGTARQQMMGQDARPKSVIKLPTSPHFVAISHVWSDGLGNPRGNSLHLCRLLEIQGIVNDLYRDRTDDNFLFWLDTLCIPQADPYSEVDTPVRLERCRIAAIKRMNIVYEMSDKVVVLDQGLGQFDKNNGLEPMLRINLSKWARRLWTLQEGSLCNKLYFRFSRGQTLSSTDIEERFKATSGNLHMAWIDYAQIFSPTIRSLADRSNKHIVAHVWQAVQWRTSEKLRDETLCLATLLELDPTSLLETKPSQRSGQDQSQQIEDSDDVLTRRMCRFLSLVDEKYGIPSGVLFLPGPKLDVDGYRWAPRTWMMSAERQFPDPLFLEGEASRPTFLTRRGLLVQHGGIRLQDKPAPSGSHFMVELRGQGLLVKRATDQCRHAGADRTGKWCESEHDVLAIIFCKTDPESRPEIALLVSIVSERHPVLWVHHLERVWISPIGQSKQLGDLRAGLRANLGDAVTGSRILPKQYWCVDGADLEAHKKKAHEPPVQVRLSRSGTAATMANNETAERVEALLGWESDMLVKSLHRRRDDVLLRNRVSNFTPPSQSRAKPRVPPKSASLARISAMT